MTEPSRREAHTLQAVQELIEKTVCKPGKQKSPCCPPAIPPALQLKWGLALLGEERAQEYLKWLKERTKSPQ